MIRLWAGGGALVLIALVAGLIVGRAWTLNGNASRHATDVWAIEPYNVRPQEFAVAPCTALTVTDDPMAPCILVMAGGKRLIFGAPDTQNWAGIGVVDAVFLLNGQPEAWNGLPGLRMASWKSGRKDRLLVVGGELLNDAIAGLDASQVAADALVQVASGDQLDFLEAGLRFKPVQVSARAVQVFNTGDLQVFATSRLDATGDQKLAYEIRYSGQVASLLSCGADPLPDMSGTVVVPVMDPALLVERLRKAQSERKGSRVLKLQEIGRNCLSGASALELAKSGKSQRLLFWRDDLSRSEPLRGAGVTYSDLSHGVVLLPG